MAIDDAFAYAVSLHRSGKIAEAEDIFRQIVSHQPDHMNAMHNLGICLSQRGDFAAALPCYAAVLAAMPNHAGAMNNIGNAMQGLRRFEDALTRYDQAIELMPGNATFHNNRANVLKELKRYAEAMESYNKALSIRPDVANAWYNRGTMLNELGRYHEALPDFDRAIGLKPDHAKAFCHRGVAFNGLGRVQDALGDFDRAIAIDSRYVEAHVNRGNALRELNRFDEALASCDTAIALAADHAQAHNIRGAVLRELKRVDEALASYAKAVELDPETPYLLGDWMHVKMNACDWNAFDQACANIRKRVSGGERVAQPFTLLAIPSTPGEQRRCAEIFAADRHPTAPVPLCRGGCYAHERIRIGYFSADFHNHATAHLIVGLFEQHDRSRFELIGFSFGPSPDDAWRRRLERAFDRFHDLRDRSDETIAAMARELEIDIAVDLKGFTQHSRAGIFALRPAPVQVSYLGYPGTMGTRYIDYLIADPTVIPREDAGCYTECIVYLPHTYQVNDSTKAIAPHSSGRRESGLPDRGFVFCSFNNNYKITPDVFDIWMRLVHEIDGSVLWLLQGNPTAVRNLRTEADKRGVAPERLVFAPYVQLPDHLARHRLADLFLDTFHYNAHTTASDALWAGLPVLTRIGGTFAGRVAASLTRAVGLDDLVTHSSGEYEERALELATHPDRLAVIRERLARNRETHPLFDTRLFTRHIENAYARMFERHQSGLPPEQIEINPGT